MVDKIEKKIICEKLISYGKEKKNRKELCDR